MGSPVPGDAHLALFFRRMRAPLVVLITAYAIATFGFTLMPGEDDQGNPWRLSLFEAFYVVSYTGSTIGFGEVPYPFSPAQRLWTIVSIYLTVVAWLFSIGTIISLLQDPAFIHSRRRSRFRRAVAGLGQPFYLVCGYGDTGRLLTRTLSEQGHAVVVLDHNTDKIEALSVETPASPVPHFRADAQRPDNLELAGLRSRWCLGVMAVTGDDAANLKIAVSAKLLNQRCTVYARADERSVADNMRSFNTDHVINPVEEYVRRMRLAIKQPAAFRLYHWLQSGPDARPPVSRRPPRGRWIVCGYGRLGCAMHAMLVDLGLEVTVIEENMDLPGLPTGTVQGRGTGADSLSAAGVETAAGILATTRDDVDNLSILITARDLNPDLYLGVLENGLSSHELFRAAEPDLIAQPSTTIAGSILARIASPLFASFIEQLLSQPDATSDELVERLIEIAGPQPPELMTVRISEKRAPALARLLAEDVPVSLEALLRRSPSGPPREALETLLLRRGDREILLPGAQTELAMGDRLLLAGRSGCSRRLRGLLENDNRLARALTGQDLHQGWLWTRLFGRPRISS